MKIGFDASRAFLNEATGTENYSLNLLRALAKIDRKNRYRVYIRSMGKWDGRKVGKKNRSNYPKNFEFVHIRPNRLWTQIGLALETWRNPVDVLFVPAHTLPILRRRKILNSKLEYRNTKQYLNSNYQNSKRLEHSDFENLNLFRISDFVLRI